MRNLDVQAVSQDIEASFAHVGARGHRYAVAVDGDLEMVLAEGATGFGMPIPAAGEHRLDVRPVRRSTREIPDLHGAAYGGRAYLTWSPSAASDVVSYQVWGYLGSAGSSSVALLATLDDIVLHPFTWRYPDGTSSDGRFSVVGDWTGPTVNADYQLETGPSSIRHDILGSWSDYYEFSQGSRIPLAYGLEAITHDPAAAYGLIDPYTFHVGPQAWWTSGELAEGTWYFAVRAVDAAGNTSSLTSYVPVKVLKLPSPVTGAAVAWDGTNVTLTWTNPGDGDFGGVYLYSNYSKATGRLKDHVIESGLWTSVLSPGASYQFVPGASGTWRFYLRSVDSSGRIGDSVQMLTVDTSGPASSLDLNTPQQVAVTAIEAGALRVSWLYDWTDGSDCDGFAVYAANDPTPISYVTPEETLAASTALGVQSYSVDLAARSDGQVVNVVVRATSGASETANTDEASGTANATAPGLPTGLGGVAT